MHTDNWGSCVVQNFDEMMNKNIYAEKSTPVTAMKYAVGQMMILTEVKPKIFQADIQTKYFEIRMCEFYNLFTATVNIPKN